MRDGRRVTNVKGAATLHIRPTDEENIHRLEKPTGSTKFDDIRNIYSIDVNKLGSWKTVVGR